MKTVRILFIAIAFCTAAMLMTPQDASARNGSTGATGMTIQPRGNHVETVRHHGGDMHHRGRHHRHRGHRGWNRYNQYWSPYAFGGYFGWYAPPPPNYWNKPGCGYPHGSRRRR